ncbi:Oidioi.mRNA.OKI2018_I69.chr1.g994.t2.cds [Oikopleura dioica]|uniref:Oidioi.mRNA.OKI2018_I69.chr1.g994.t2.cds n=1 Tax=Oikopleura dioica TaxID=34765 RepID=A0ABN7SQW6_OIKDI|nr:Oidioi.mRNA.OKI2018_I69.chr1.g994.t2.cds [Oikopleura dioica]
MPSDLNIYNTLKGYVFLKKHKTASTTFRGIMANVGKNLSFDGEHNWLGPQGGCYPAPFGPTCWPYSEDGSHLEKIEALSYHFRWNLDYMPKLLENNRQNIRTITSIRDPLETYRSVFNYFYGAKRKGPHDKCDITCFGEPYWSLTKNENLTIGEFLDDLDDIYTDEAPYAFRTKSIQAYEMGMELKKMDDPKYVRQSLIEMDKQFDLVIITEHFWESIVLLAHLMCVEYSTLYREYANKKDYEVPPLTPKQMSNFEKYNKVDIELYNFFNASLHEKIDAFGRVRMRTEIILAKRAYQKCAKSKTDECLHNHHRPKGMPKKMEPRLKLSTFVDLMERYEGKCNHASNNAYVQAKKMLETGTWDNECEHGREMLENMVFDTKVPMSKDLPFIPQKGPNADYFK